MAKLTRQQQHRLAAVLIQMAGTMVEFFEESHPELNDMTGGDAAAQLSIWLSRLPGDAWDTRLQGYEAPIVEPFSEQTPEPTVTIAPAKVGIRTVRSGDKIAWNVSQKPENQRALTVDIGGWSHGALAVRNPDGSDPRRLSCGANGKVWLIERPVAPESLPAPLANTKVTATVAPVKAKAAVYTAEYQGQTRTRISKRTYTHASVVYFPNRDEAVIYSFHSSEAAARKGSLAGIQTQNGALVIAVVPVTVA